jgi:hypothetical protein
MDEVLVAGFLKFQPIDIEHWERNMHRKKEWITIMDVLNMYVSLIKLLFQVQFPIIGFFHIDTITFLK